MIWIDMPSFRTDSVVRVEYDWLPQGFRYARMQYTSTEAATGFAFGYRGTDAIKNDISVAIHLKGDAVIRKHFPIRRYLEETYGIVMRMK
jgi:hypothetical protein